MGFGEAVRSFWSNYVNFKGRARRLHDTNRSGWWMPIGFVPVVGGIVILVFTVTDSGPSQNKYGPSPKAGFSL